MIQRIQSLYLLLTTIISILFLNGVIIEFAEKAGSFISLYFNEINRSLNGSEVETLDIIIPFSMLLLIIPLFSFVAIFLYKNRKLQMKVVSALILLLILEIIAIIFYAYKVINEYNSELIYGTKLLTPVLNLVLAILAYRGIKKDEELVKSYDRLR